MAVLLVMPLGDDQKTDRREGEIPLESRVKQRQVEDCLSGVMHNILRIRWLSERQCFGQLTHDSTFLALASYSDKDSHGKVFSSGLSHRSIRHVQN